MLYKSKELRLRWLLPVYLTFCEFRKIHGESENCGGCFIGDREDNNFYRLIRFEH